MNPKHISTQHVNHENDFNCNATAAPPPTPVSPNSSLIDGLPSFGDKSSTSNVSTSSSATMLRNGGGGQPLAPLLMTSLLAMNDDGSKNTLTLISGPGGMARTASGAQTPGTGGGGSAPLTGGDIQQKSRFHIIKINTGPCRRGRWMCTDTDDGAEAPSNASAKHAGAANVDHVIIPGGGGSGASSGGRPSYHNVPIFIDEAQESSLAAALNNGGGNGIGGAHAPHPSYQQQLSQHSLNSDNNSGVGASVEPSNPTVHKSTSTAKFVAQPVGGAGGAMLTSSSTPAETNSPAAATAGLSIPAAAAATNQQLQSLMGLHNQNSGGGQQQSSGSGGLGVHPSSAFVPVISASSTFLNPGTFVSAPQAAFGSSTGGSADFFTYPHHTQHGDVTGLSGASVLFGKILPQQIANDTIMVTQVNPSLDGSSAASSGTNANIVAIDNKIEQAMDLVKTHLLYAVREEVEILKVRIVELEKKVGNLEKENKILREYAPPEILAQLASSSSHQMQQSTQQQQQQPQQHGTTLVLQQTQQTIAQQPTTVAQSSTPQQHVSTPAPPVGQTLQSPQPVVGNVHLQQQQQQQPPQQQSSSAS